MLDWQWNLDDAKAAWKEEAREEGWAEGINHGRSAEREKIAAKMLRRGRSVEEIHDLTDLPLNLIQQLKSQSPASE